MSLDTEHLGFKISFDEHNEQWRCWEISIASKSLKAVKQAISKRDADERRVGNLPAIRIQGFSEPKPCIITLVADDKREVWIIVEGRREKISPSNLALDTPEARAALTKAAAHETIAEREKKLASASLALIPRLTIAELLSREAAALPEI